MYRFFLRVIFFVGAMVMTVCTQAQTGATGEKPQMATGMRADGKIYVVVAVLLIILSGIFIYLVRLDRKISRLEKNNP
jgi:CcmD family protein